MAGSVDALSLLKGVDLFASLSDNELLQIAALTSVQSFKRDETIILERDDSAMALYIVMSGSVQVFVTAQDGRETILSLLTRGDFFGELSLIDGEPRSASVRANSDVNVLVLMREDFLTMLDNKPGIAKSLLVELSTRLRRSNKQISSLSSMSVFGRVAGTILSLGEQHGIRVPSKDGNSATVVRNRPTQQQLADMSGTTRETVSRIFASLEKKGLIAVNDKELVIFDDLQMENI